MKTKQNEHLEYDKVIAEIAFNMIKMHNLPQTRKNFLNIVKQVDQEFNIN